MVPRRMLYFQNSAEVVTIHLQILALLLQDMLQNRLPPKTPPEDPAQPQISCARASFAFGAKLPVSGLRPFQQHE